MQETQVQSLMWQIPQASEQRSPHATSTGLRSRGGEPQLLKPAALSPCSATREADTLDSVALLTVFTSLWASLVAQTRICLQYRVPVLSPWVGKIPGRRKWQPTPVFLPREFHGQRSLESCSSRGCKESDTTEGLMHNKPGILHSWFCF